jgi:hypothetical protein
MTQKTSRATPFSLLAFLLCLAFPIQAQAQDYGGEMRDLIASKCLSCHEPASDNRKAKRELDRAWDMRAVIDTWGDPIAMDFSPFWEVVEDNSMPPKDSDVTALTEEERALSFAWMEAGMPLPADGNPFVDLELAAKHTFVFPEDSAQEDADPALSGFDRLARWTGRQHAATTHFPVALLFLAGALRLWTWIKRRGPFHAQEGFCLLIGAPMAAVSAGLGWLNAANSGAGGDDLFYHRWVGVGLTVLALLLLLGRKHREHRAYGVALLILLILVAAGGHLGGELVFGESYLAF